MTKKTVLIVEDESLVARDIEGMVTGLGYNVSAVASSGEAAIRAAAEKGADIILMDIILKGKMDGIAAVEEIRRSRDVPVVYLTAYADDETLERAKKTNPQGYLLKPFEVQELRTAIDFALHKFEEEQRLQTSERGLASILDHLGDAVIACDAEGRISFMNPLAESISGWKSAEALGRLFSKTIRFLRPESAKPLAVSTRSLLRKEISDYPVRCRLKTRGGEEIPVDLRASFLGERRKNLAHVVFVLRKVAPAPGEERDLAYAAIYDSLTGLPNRVLFEDRLDLAIAQAARKDEKLAVAIMDLGGLKAAAGAQGPDAADAMRKEAAVRITRSLRSSDTAARIGTDRFALLLPDVSGVERLREIEERIRKELRREIETDRGMAGIHPDIGTSIFPDNGSTVGELIEKAESALSGPDDRPPVSPRPPSPAGAIPEQRTIHEKSPRPESPGPRRKREKTLGG
jgi:diguanylate cyclase (GGDEF)-like protein/PAS domain S-box-containing protein